MAIISFDVLWRQVSKPTTWAGEISSIICLWVPFLAAPWLLKEDTHIKVDLIFNYLPFRLRSMVSLVTSFIGFLVTGVMAIESFFSMIRWIGFKTPTILMLPKTPLISVIFIGCLLISLQFLINTIQNLNRWRERN